MILIGEKEEKGWVHANYRLTRPVSWQQLLKAVHGVYGYFKKTEILVDGLPIQIGQPEEILQTPESNAISIRGVLTIIDVPVVVTFYNQVHFINVRVECNNEELKNLDYEHYNKFIGKFIDNMEIAMNMPEEQLKAGR